MRRIQEELTPGRRILPKQREIEINGSRLSVDEWNDAVWIELPKRAGNLTAYSAFKCVLTDSEQALYEAHDLTSVTEESFSSRASAVTAFDPLHDGGNQEAKPDDFEILPYWDRGQRVMGFGVFARYGGSDQKTWGSTKYGEYQEAPEGVVAASSLCATPNKPKPHLFFEVRIPLGAGGLDKRLNSTIGLYQGAHNVNYNVAPIENFNNAYPYGKSGDFIANDYADATFSKTTNPNPTVPPTTVPEYRVEIAPLVAVATLLTTVLLTRRRRIR